MDPPDGAILTALPLATADRIESGAGRLHPRFPGSAVRGVVHRAVAALPTQADGAFELTDQDSGVRVEVALLGASPAKGRVVGGFVVYPRGLASGADVIHRPTAEGTEDYLSFERAPANAEVLYELTLGEKVAGLRLVARTVELLDAGGVPRLRMAPPYLIDATGARREAAVEVRGCAFDADPTAPQGRPVTAAGAGTCAVRIAWNSEEIRYPALLDPAWTTTGSLGTARYDHAASVLDDGAVLVAGGTGASGTAVKSAEIYDPLTRTWSATSEMNSPRRTFTASLLQSGQVLAAGGEDSSGTALASAELYDRRTGTWSVTGSMPSAHRGHTASVLPSRDVVLVAGGKDGMGNDSARAAEFNQGTWTSTNNLTAARSGHTASVLQDDRVLVVGGTDGARDLAAAEIYDPATGRWSPTDSLRTARTSHTASVLPDHRVLAAGGFAGYRALTSAELYDPTSRRWIPTAGHLAVARAGHTSVTLRSDEILFAGGDSNSGVLAGAEIYDPSTDQWSAAGHLSDTRKGHIAVLLGNGNVLLAGGRGVGDAALASAEEYYTGWDCRNVICPPPGPCQLPGGCNPLNGYCSFPSSPDGTPCDDGNPCSVPASGTCVGGECTGISPKSCPPLDGCHGEGACDRNDGQCKSYPDLCAGGVPATRFGSLCTTPKSRQECAKLKGFCVQEGEVQICCRSECKEPCHSCALPGKAGVCGLEPEDVDLRGDCGTPASCDQTCPGIEGAECKRAKEGTQCAPGRCIGKSRRRGPAACTDTGAACPDGEEEDCGFYACNPADGECRKHCYSVADCADGLACDGDHRCVPPVPAAQGVDPTCAFAPSAPAARTSSGAAGALGAAGLCAALAARRRRRTASGGPRTSGEGPSAEGDVMVYSADRLRIVAIGLFATVIAFMGSCSTEGREGQENGPPQASGRRAPGGLRAAYIARLQRGAPDNYDVEPIAPVASWRAQNDAQRFVTEFDDGGVVLSAIRGAWSVSLRTSAVGCEAERAAIGAAEPVADANRIHYEREDLKEWYLNGPLGLEQGFVLTGAPSCAGTKIVEIALGGDLQAELVDEDGDGRGEAVELRDDARHKALHYSDLYVKDATGNELSAWLSLEAEGIAIHLDDRGAVYPVEIDPLIWTQEAQLTASDGAVDDRFGVSVALSGDTALVGAYNDEVGTNASQGSAYVFTRADGRWSQQQKLIASDGAVYDGFGISVALSGDTALVGAYNDEVGTNASQGSAYVFTRTDGRWTQQQKLIASDGAVYDGFGISVALSGDTALVGAYNDEAGTNASQGSAYVFTRTDGRWTEQQKLNPSDDVVYHRFGISVALSGDTALVGAYNDDVGTNASQGSAYVFRHTGGRWAQQQRLIASDGAADDVFGISVALSGDTALVGAYSDDIGRNVNQGSVYVYTRAYIAGARVRGGVWTQQQKIIASDGAVNDMFGISVALSEDTALVGAYSDNVETNVSQGSAYVFTRTGGVWTQQRNLTASDGAADDWFGTSVALSGNRALVGAYSDDVEANADRGSAYIFIVPVRSGACSTGAECVSGYCADGVCCDTACGGGNTSDCQACSVALGATVDGTCTRLTGTPCDDGDACTQTDTCQAGRCNGPDRIQCAPSGPCQLSGTCNPLNGACSYPHQPDGELCDDGDACTEASTCKRGVCVSSGPAKTCPAQDSCHGDGTCDPRDGKCKHYPDLCADPGTPVDFGSGCNTPEREAACEALGGVCVSEGHPGEAHPPRVCCRTDCQGSCRSCAVPGSAGRCVDEPKGMDLRKDCSKGDACLTTCSGPGPAGDPHCIDAEQGTQCAPARCLDRSHSLGAALCPSYGAVCPESLSQDCSPFACNPVDGLCQTECAAVSDCAPDFACRQGKCVSPPPVAQGRAPSCAHAPTSPVGSEDAGALATLVLLAVTSRRRGRIDPAARALPTSPRKNLYSGGRAG
ncbi:kelch repeat-containing protein [Sorangium cellulosum]|uniref:Kelch repeat-containing protein n=1 Tax=Sorangium cellulosum TaxID=56 RepID=UPI003D9A68A2